MTRAARILRTWVPFLALTSVVTLVASSISHASAHAQRGGLSAAATLDLTLTIPLGYYWFLVRLGVRSKGSLFFVALLGLWRASFLFPALFPGAVPGRIWIGAGVECAFLAAVVLALRGSSSVDSDPAERIYAALVRLIPSQTAARAASSEMAVLWYAFAWKARPHIPTGSRAFTVHRRGGVADLFLAMVFLSALEIPAIHLLLAHAAGTKAAWIATGLSVYGMVWLIAMRRAMTLRPLLVRPEGILVRFGLLFSLWIPAEKIRSVTACDAASGGFSIPRDMPAQWLVKFTEPLTALRFAGFTKKLSAIGLSTDDAAQFAAALKSHTP